jgi:cytochrome b subunit of formate dehydrogenase
MATSTATSSSRRDAHVYALLKKTVRWLLLAAILLYLVSGLGISEFRTVENLTFGLLTKDLAFRLHDVLLVPFIALLILHVGLPPLSRLLRRF